MEDLREEFELEGVWWLKGDENIQKGGVVKYTPGERINLNLIAGFENTDWFSEKIKYTLHGYCNKVGYITLFDCSLYHSGSSSGVMNNHFLTSQMLIGAYFDNVEELVFKTVSCRFSNFEEWVDLSSWQINHDDENKLQLTYETLGPIEVYSGKNFKIWFDFGKENYSINFYYQKQFSINQFSALRIEYEQPVILKEYLKVIEKIKRLLSIFLGKPVFIKSLLLFKEQNKKDDERFDPDSSNLLYIYPQSYFPTKLNVLEKSEMLSAFPVIKEDIQTVFSNWFDKYELLEPVFNLYFSTVYNSGFNTRDYFINLIQAIESFHRRIYEGISFPQEQYDQLVIQIIDSIPEIYKKHLIDKLKYGNEWSLNKRLKDLFKKHSGLFSFTINDFKEFAFRISQTRNYFIHYDKDCEEKAYKGIELHEAGKKLNALMIACILEQVGFDNAKIFDTFRKSSKWSRYLFA